MQIYYSSITPIINIYWNSLDNTTQPGSSEGQFRWEAALYQRISHGQQNMFSKLCNLILLKGQK